MTNTSALEEFIRRREAAYQRLDRVRADIDALLSSFALAQPTMGQLAQLEALRMERQELLGQYQILEDSFLDRLLKTRHRASVDGAQPSVDGTQPSRDGATSDSGSSALAPQ